MVGERGEIKSDIKGQIGLRWMDGDRGQIEGRKRRNRSGIDGWR